MDITIILNEFAQFGFIASWLYFIYMITTFIIIMYGKVKLNKTVAFKPKNSEKVLLWLAITYIFAFII